MNSYLLYTSKLHPNRDDLWQRPRDAFLPSDDVWYMDIPVGKNTLSSIMSEISRIGKLSCVYKNHSVRATSITLMDEAGIAGRHIMSVSGHQSETSLKSYSHHVSNTKKREISDTLSAALGHETGQPTPEQTLDLNDNTSVFNDDFELEQVDLSNLNSVASTTVMEHNVNQFDVMSNMSRGLLSFNPNFSGNCTVNININVGNK